MVCLISCGSWQSSVPVSAPLYLLMYATVTAIVIRASNNSVPLNSPCVISLMVGKEGYQRLNRNPAEASREKLLVSRVCFLS